MNFWRRPRYPIDFLYGPVTMAATDITSDIDTYILTGNVNKTVLFAAN